ncbi:hypothetical protein [Pseudomonas fluorescens group sp. PF-69]
MSRKPSLSSLRAGQTLYLVDAKRTAHHGAAQVAMVQVSNADVRYAHDVLKGLPPRAFYSRRRALSCARQLARQQAQLKGALRSIIRALASEGRP